MKKVYIILSLILVVIGAVVVINRTPKSVDIKPTNTPNYSGKDFSLTYPEGYTVDESYKYQALGPGKEVSGVKFTIPTSFATGTNLSADSYISVEHVANLPECSVIPFTMKGTTASIVRDGGTTYLIATSSDAAAGNRYDETIYAIPGTNPCIAIRYFIHSTVFENYPAGSILQFDKQALINQFDQIRRTLVVHPVVSENTDSSNIKCLESPKYVAVQRNIKDDVGSDILVKFKTSADQKIPCKYSVAPGDFEVKENGSAQYFLVFTTNFLALDSSVDQDPRTLTIYNLNTKKQVYEDTYSKPITQEGDVLTYWTPTNTKATAQNCTQYKEYTSKYTGAFIESQVRLDLSTLTKKELGESRCMPLQ